MRITKRLSLAVAIVVMLCAICGCGAEKKWDGTIEGLKFTESDYMTYPNFKVPEDNKGNVLRDATTLDDPPMQPTLNSVLDYPIVGDERDFVRVAEKGSNGQFNDWQRIEAGKPIQLRF